MAIERLPTVSALSSSDSIAIAAASLGADARATLATLLAFLQPLLTVADAEITQYAAPIASGFAVQMSPLVNGGSVFLLLTPTGPFAAGTLLMPLSSQCVDKQQLVVFCSQVVTALTINGNGAVVNGGPTTLAANGFFRLRFDGVAKAWYRVA